MRRGLVSEINWYALQARKELGVGERDPIDPWKLADLLGFKVFTLQELSDLCPEQALQVVNIKASEKFSAVRLRLDASEAWIVHNDLHNKKRQAANICHELAHAYLMHPMDTITDLNGKRTINREHEEEAQRLGPALLISEPAALHIARQAWTLSEASEIYGASEDVVRMRLNLTGAYRRARRRAA